MLTTASCQDALVRYGTGDAITFAVSGVSAETRASYSGDLDGTKERIDWEVNDTIRIFCAQVSEPESKYADYRVSAASTEGGAVSDARIEGLGGVGLRWGSGDHTFYAVYPSPKVDGVATGISGSTVTANLPAVQGVSGDITSTGGNYTAKPDLKNMLMTARSAAYNPTDGIPSGEVFLSFIPLTTAIEFTITNGTGAELDLTAVQLISGNGKTGAEPVISGAFSVDLDQEPPACTSASPTSADQAADRTLTINVGTAEKPLAIAEGKSFTFTFFLNPVHDFDDLSFRIVKSDDSFLSTRLGYTDGSGIEFPKSVKSTVKGLLVPEGAQWTVKYAPQVNRWSGSGSVKEPSPEVDIQPVVTKWETGTVSDIEMLKYNYTLGIAGEVSFGHEGSGGDTTTLTLTSDRQYGHGASADVVWHMEYYDEATSQWAVARAGEEIGGLVTLTMDGISSGGSILGSGGATISMAVSAGTASAVGTHTQRLQDAQPKGRESAPYDLSMHTIYGDARTLAKTANCYVVRSQGWYAFPLVYGNAIDDNVAPAGFINVNAYNPGGETDPTPTILTRFKNYRGQGIRLPYIEQDLETSLTGWSATTLWSDAPFIDGVQLLTAGESSARGLTDNPCGYVLFHVNGDICQGNAVIAVRDNENRTVWSWHIWVTDDELDPVTYTNYSGQIIGMLPVNLGWVDSDTGSISYYSGKAVRFRLVQEGSNIQREFTVTRRPETTASHAVGSSTYYQWGRKDPFRAVIHSKVANDASSTDLAYSIQHPDTLVTGTYYYSESINAVAAHYYNLWSALNKGLGTAAGNYGAATIKTIYDPCPPGFRIPHGTAYTGLTATGTNATVISDLRVSGSFSGGWNFVTGSGSETNFFNAVGCIGDDGAVVESCVKGYYWTSVPKSGSGSTIAGQDMNFWDMGAAVVGTKTQGHGCAVRPVMEEHL